MGRTITLRRSGPGDWAAVADLHAASWRSAYRGIYPDSYLDGEAPEERRVFWRSALAAMDAERGLVLLAEADGEAVGFACLLREAGAPPLLDNLHVLPERKGEGIGRRLIAGAAAWLVGKEPGAPLELGVWADNRAARRFYAGLGGREIRTDSVAIPGGGTAPQVRVRWERAAELTL